MPVRMIPFDQLTVAHFEELVARSIREDETLEFKEVLALGTVSERVSLVQDVVAMANTSGGTIVYGAVEGEGEDRGMAVCLSPTALSPDETQQVVSNLLRDGVDEPLHGVHHRAIPSGDGKYLYVIRVPASPLAPHMVKLKDSRWRYYYRAATPNNRMTARQAKEAALRAETAFDRAEQHSTERAEAVRRRAESCSSAETDRDVSAIVAHLIPLFSPVTSIDLADDGIAKRLERVLPFGMPYEGRVRWALEGLYSESSSGGAIDAWALLTRRGMLEFGAIGVMNSAPWA